MQILSASQLKQCDEHTISQEQISSLDLMERAAKACIPAILKYADIDAEFVVFCGKGNNGGDGLAITRLLIQQHYKARAILVNDAGALSIDCEATRKALEALSSAALIHVRTEEELHNLSFPGTAIFIDALIGIGLNKPVEGLLGATIDLMNSKPNVKLSVDIPSGLYADVSSRENKHIVKANKTFTFQTPKLAFMMAENAPYVSNFEVIPIGLDQNFILDLKSQFSFLQKHHLRFLFQPRPKFSHKGTYGHALLIGGSKGKSGAIILAAKACLKSGAGLLTVHSCEQTLSALLNQLPEAMSSYDEEEYISGFPDKVNFTVVGIGPGLGNRKETENVLKLLIQNAAQPIVFDADAINILAENKTWISFINEGCVFTPHVKEFDRLTQAHQSDFDRLQTAIEFCVKHRQILLLKGAYSAVITPSGKVYFNSTGNPAMAKGGSGDVLTGIITGLISRGYEPEQASVIGVYIHGAAADLCVKKQSKESITASDVIDKLGKAFLKIEPQSFGSLK